jgi:hypothetical protein
MSSYSIMHGLSEISTAIDKIGSAVGTAKKVVDALTPQDKAKVYTEFVKGMESGFNKRDYAFVMSIADKAISLSPDRQEGYIYGHYAGLMLAARLASSGATSSEVMEQYDRGDAYLDMLNNVLSSDVVDSAKANFLASHPDVKPAVDKLTRSGAFIVDRYMPVIVGGGAALVLLGIYLYNKKKA